MDTYTEKLDTQLREINILGLNAGDYQQKLLEAAKSFRPFSESLTAFLLENGYDGDPADWAAKTAFVRSRYSLAGMKAPQNIPGWFDGTIRFRRETAFPLCFAFGLDKEGTDAFFQRVMLERSFDCHLIREAVYYYAARNRLSWNEVQEILENCPKVKPGKADLNTEQFFTGSIIRELEKCQSTKDLLAFLNANADQFLYNNATATQTIISLWNQIDEKEGILDCEHKIAGEIVTERSVDVTLRQILFGIDPENRLTLLEGEDRSLKPILKDNDLLPAIAEQEFPDREKITRILHGDHVSHESARKLLILLYFYKYWASKMNKTKKTYYQQEEKDVGEFLDRINDYLLDSGFQKLYIGNPYDWIFLLTGRHDDPLATFRFFMNELNTRKIELRSANPNQRGHTVK